MKVAQALSVTRTRGAGATGLARVVPPRGEDPGPQAPRTLPLPARGEKPAGGFGLVSIRLADGRKVPGPPTDASTGRAAAKILRDPPHGFETMDAFGKALGWGAGPDGNATSFARIRTLTRADLDALGLTLEEATRIRDAYRAVVSLPKGATNPNALGRALLLGKAVDLLSA